MSPLMFVQKPGLGKALARAARLVVLLGIVFVYSTAAASAATDSAQTPGSDSSEVTSESVTAMGATHVSNAKKHMGSLLLVAELVGAAAIVILLCFIIVGRRSPSTGSGGGRRRRGGFSPRLGSRRLR